MSFVADIARTLRLYPTTKPAPLAEPDQDERDERDERADILPQVAGPNPRPCCDRYTNTRLHARDCGADLPAERFPISGPRGPLYTDVRYRHLNTKGGDHR